MRAVIQRVSNASVRVNDGASSPGKIAGKIGNGVVVFLGVHINDTEQDCSYIADKILNLRIFDDSEGRMNLSVLDIKGEVLVVSQFTLYGDTRKGRRPSYNDAAAPEKGCLYYKKVVEIIRSSSLKTETGEFGALMEVEYVNDGPVTILVDSFKEF
ncbi:MAG: D-aminoacyl-tRNA deacylase [Spirochaetes bacterium]|nr:D-aminoacyl-tRNA deacylase [Spirochaetota bacterium]